MFENYLANVRSNNDLFGRQRLPKSVKQ